MESAFVKVFRILSLWLFWPGIALIIWGELTPNPPDLSGVLGWDKAQHFLAYFGLASMATMILGLRPRLAWAILGVILLGGALEILQGYTGRDPDIRDFVANTFGALSGAAVGAVFLFAMRGPALVAETRSD
jgi:VanZ family protein